MRRLLPCCWCTCVGADQALLWQQSVIKGFATASSARYLSETTCMCCYLLWHQGSAESMDGSGRSCRKCRTHAATGNSPTSSKHHHQGSPQPLRPGVGQAIVTCFNELGSMSPLVPQMLLFVQHCKAPTLHLNYKPML